MVKNVKGGKGHKSMARKSIMTKERSTRLPENELELFAVVKKFYGNMCDIVTHTNLELKCHIPGKFKGKAKRNAYVAVGKILLIGLRHYETTHKNCDLLCVYDTTAYPVLHSLAEYNLSKLFAISSSISSVSSGTLSVCSALEDELIFNDDGEPTIDISKPSISVATASALCVIQEKPEDEEKHAEDEINIEDI